MSFDFEERASESPLVARVWRATSECAGSFISRAATHWEMVMRQYGDETTMIVRGPETRASQLDFPAGLTWFGITFELGAYMPHLPLREITDHRDVNLPLATGHCFWLDHSTWQMPCYENADTFVGQLVHKGLLAYDPVVASTLEGRPCELSARSQQYRFLQATGLTRKARRFCKSNAPAMPQPSYNRVCQFSIQYMRVAISTNHSSANHCVDSSDKAQLNYCRGTLPHKLRFFQDFILSLRDDRVSITNHQQQRINLVRKVVISVYSTLDGIIQPIDWTGHYATPEHAPYARQQLFEADALLMGRETYEIFASVWPVRTSDFDAPGSEGYVQRINSLPKYVASTTLQEPLAWNNSRVIKGDVAEAVTELKRQPGLNLLMYGAGPVAYTLIQNGLVDELQIWLYPVIAGNGVRLFTGASDMPYLQLRDARRFESGIMILTYEPENRRNVE